MYYFALSANARLRKNKLEYTALMDSDTRFNSFFRWQTVSVPTVLSIVLLAAQLWVMGWGEGFPTQDGPAHLHIALVWCSLLLEQNTVFHRFCELAKYLPRIY